MTREERKQQKLEQRKKRKEERGSVYQQFKKFISRGNVLDMSVGVIMGGAFSAIANAFTKILMSVCTWMVPGGINGLVTVLPAITQAQRGTLLYTQKGEINYNEKVESVIIEATTGDNAHERFEFKPVHVQKFDKTNVNKISLQYAAANERYNLTVNDSDFNQWKNSLTELYELHGNTYTYKQSAVIDWGTLINALLQFLIIASSLFVVLKVYTVMKDYTAEFQADMQVRYEEYKKEKEEEAKRIEKESSDNSASDEASKDTAAESDVKDSSTNTTKE